MMPIYSTQLEPTIPTIAKPRRTSKRKPKDDNEVTRIELDINDIQREQVHLLERPHLQEFIAKAEKEVEEAHEEGTKLVGSEKWLKIRQAVKNSPPPSRLEDYEVPDSSDKLEPKDGELRNEVRFYIWYRPGIKRALERARKRQEEGVETETESEDEMKEIRPVERSSRRRKN